MKKYILYIIIVLLVSCNAKNTKNFTINTKSSNTNIYIDEHSDELVKWAANDFSEDIEKIVEREITIIYTDKFHPDKKGIYIGKFDDKLIEGLPHSYNSQLKNKWEKFVIKKYQGNLFIVGSDIRGTVYGIFDVAERIGISPWKWWADVRTEKKESMVLNLPQNGIEDSPSVQYRGIFLNDEDWGLQPWAAKTFEPQTGDIGPKTYEKIFQLLLRLKANTIWPAMHPSTKAFFTIPGNGAMAEKYHISIGTSHAEPMLRNNIHEWDKKAYGEFNYFTNSKNVKDYWTERISKTKNGNILENITDANDPDRVFSFSVDANTDVVLKPYLKIYSTGTVGQGDQAASRQIIYNVPIPDSPTEGVKVEFHDTFEDTTAWKGSTWGTHAVQNIGGSAALRVAGTQIASGAPKASLIGLNWSGTNANLASAHSLSGHFLSYDAQVKVGFDPNPLPVYGFCDYIYNTIDSTSPIIS